MKKCRLIPLIKSEFNKSAKDYEQKAFKESLGLKYLSSIETSFIQKYIKRGSADKLLLDEGIGSGRNSRILLKKGYKVIGLDFSKNMLNQCKKNLYRYIDKKQLDLKEYDLNKSLPFQNNTFDGAICIRNIKYIKNWRQLIKETGRIIMPNGIFILEFSNIYSVQFISQMYNIYFSFRPIEVEKVLNYSGFVVLAKKYGTKLPFNIYQKINSPYQLKKINQIEAFLSKIFASILSRNLIFYCKKINYKQKGKI